jgi:biotin carboxyl carrier protein
LIYDITINGHRHRLELEVSGGQWRCRLDRREILVDATLVRRDVLSILIAGKAYEVKRERSPEGIHIWVGGRRYAADVSDPRSLRARQAALGAESGPKKLLAPMPGKVVRLLVAEKSEVEVGQGILVVEAMKMQNELKSPKKGTVQKLLASTGVSVNAGEVLAIVD